jgi:hypothetical protein
MKIFLPDVKNVFLMIMIDIKKKSKRTDVIDYGRTVRRITLERKGKACVYMCVFFFRKKRIYRWTFLMIFNGWQVMAR